jgi:hypothetical protein
LHETMFNSVPFLNIAWNNVPTLSSFLENCMKQCSTQFLSWILHETMFNSEFLSWILHETIPFKSANVSVHLFPSYCHFKCSWTICARNLNYNMTKKWELGMI